MNKPIVQSVASEHMLIRKLKKLNYEQAIKWVLNKLRYVEQKGIMNAPGWAPWHLLEFLKYSAKHSIGRRKIEERKILSIYTYFDSYIKNKPDKLLQEEHGDINRFMFHLAHQQFPLQKKLEGLKYNLTRQLVFFSEFDNSIYKECGIGIQDFMKLSFALTVHVLEGQRKFTKDHFKDVYNDDLVETFLGLVSISPDELKNALRANIVTSVYNYRPFTETPLIHLPNGYFIVFENIFYIFLSYYIYERIKKERVLRSRFGELFQEYIEEAVLNKYPDALTDKEFLKKVNGCDEPSQVDALISLENSLLFLECKATEIPEYAIMNPQSDLFGSLKSNLVKAISQLYKQYKYMSDNKDLFDGFDLDKEIFLLIVTYKDTYLGTAQRYWEYIQPILEEEHGIYDASKVIKPENIFFISVESFDWLMSLGEQVEEALRTASSKFIKHELFDLRDEIKTRIDRNSFSIPKLEQVFEGFFEDCLKCYGLWEEYKETNLEKNSITLGD